MGKVARIIAKMPEVNRAVGQGAARLAGFVRAEAVTHGTLAGQIEYAPVDDTDWEVFYDKYDSKGRGVGAPLEMGHENVPRRGKWTWGIHVLRDAIDKAAIF